MTEQSLTDTVQLLLMEGKKAGFSTVEAYGESIEKQEYECFPEEPPALHTADTQRVVARSFWEYGDPVGFSLSRPRPASIKAAFLDVYDTHLLEQRENFRRLLPSKIEPKAPSVYDESIFNVKLQTVNELVERIQEIIITPTFRGLKLQRLLFSKSLKKIYIGNTNGLNAKYMKTHINLQMTASVQNNHIDISENRVFFHQLEPYKIISRAFNLLNSLQVTEHPGPRTFPGGRKKLSLVLSPEASAFILREFSQYFRMQPDREITGIQYPAILNIVDNPFMEAQPGSVPFDDEGIQSGETFLIRRGVFSGVISDLSEAFEVGSKPTGNGFRNERIQFPTTRFSNLHIKPTVLPLKNLMTDAGEGILVSLLKLKYVDKDGYLFSAYGYRFRDNEIKEPVHLYFKTTFRSYFLNVVKVSKEIKFFYSTYNIGSPYILTEAHLKGDGTYEI
jgi:predicted Zn-dependent protease